MNKKNGDFVDQRVYNTLNELFKVNPSKGIAQSEAYLKSPNYTKYEDFLEEVTKTQKSQCCTVSWEKEMLSARCLDCQLQDNSCICIPCYLAGKHDQHHSYLLGGSGAGNCDCGDYVFWKTDRNCPKHTGQDKNPDITQMTSDSRVKFITVFLAALTGALSVDLKDALNEANCIACFIWVENYIVIGDGLRRCVSIAISCIDPEFFFASIQNMTKPVITVFLKLLGGLVSDHHFSDIMGRTLFKFYQKLQKTYVDIKLSQHNKKEPPVYPLGKFLSYCFHFFNEATLSAALDKENFDWVKFALDCIEYSIDTVCKLGEKDGFKGSESGITARLWYIEKLLDPLSKREDQKANIQTFVDKYSQILIKCERAFSFRLLEEPMGDSINVCMSYIDLIRKLDSITRVVSKGVMSISETFKSLLSFLETKPFDVYSIFADNIPISNFLPLHVLFCRLILNHSDIPSIIKSECIKNKVTVDQFCKLASILPLRIIASAFFPVKCTQFLNRFYTYSFNLSFTMPDMFFMDLFILNQILIGTTSDKEGFIRNIITTFGAYSNPVRAEEAAIFLMELVLDRSLIRQDNVMITRLRTIALLKEKPASTTDIESEVDEKLSNPLFGDDILSYAERVTTKSGSHFHLKDDAEFTIFFPLLAPSRRNKIITQLHDKLAPFLDFVELPFGLSMKSCLMCPSFTSLMIECLISPSILAAHVGLVMFVTTVRNSDCKYKVPTSEIRCLDLMSMPTSIAKFNNIFDFFVIRADLRFSLIQLVQIKKELGISALEKTDLPIELRPEQNEKARLKHKMKAKLLKESIMNNFHDRMNSYLSSASTVADEDDNEPMSARPSSRIITSSLGNSRDELKCVICNEATKDVIAYPCMAVPSMFPAIVDNRLHNLNKKIENLEAVTSFNICLHQVHVSCSVMGKKKFNCSVDRGERNCLLPIISEKIGQTPSPPIRDAVDIFFDQAFILRKNEPIIHPLESFAGAIKILEVRHRSRPECLDHPSVPALLENLFKSYYIKLHGCSIIQDITDPLIKLMYFLINSICPALELSSFVQQISNMLDDDYLLEFLRRAAIVQHFALDSGEMDSSKFIDWDEILSFECLSKRFGITKKCDNELPVFGTIPLPERYVSLYQPPYNYEIFDFAIVRFVDLLTGDVVIYTRNEEKTQSHLPFLSQHSSNYHGGLLMLMSLTGPNASDVIFNCDFLYHHPWNMGGFYVDQFGDTDRGFRRGAMLTLSKDKLDNILDMLLAGEYVLYK